MNFSVFLALVAVGIIAVCKIYGLIVGICTIFVGIKLVFASQVFSGQTILLSLDLEDYVPFFIFNQALSKLLLGLALLSASFKKGSFFRGLLGGGNVFGGMVGLFGGYTSTVITLTGFWGGIVSISLLLWLGCLTITAVLPSDS